MIRRGICTHRYAEVNPIISVDLLSDTADDRVLDQFVALPLQADSLLRFRPAVRIHPTTVNHSRDMYHQAGGTGLVHQNPSITAKELQELFDLFVPTLSSLFQYVN